MSANKVILNGETLIDLTQDSISENDVIKGKTFHKANGEQASGTYEVPSGETQLNTNGTHDVSKFATAKVNVPNTIPDGYIQPTGTFDITENGDYNISAYEKVKVNIKTGNALPLVEGVKF